VITFGRMWLTAFRVVAAATHLQNFPRQNLWANSYSTDCGNAVTN